MMAYSEYYFSDESWQVMTSHLISYLQNGNEFTQKSFIEASLYCLNKRPTNEIPRDLLIHCEKYLVPKDLSISNKVTLAGIYAKNQYQGRFFDTVMSQLDDMSVTQMLNSGGGGTVENPSFDKFGFEQAAILVNCLRTARVINVPLMDKIQQLLIIKEGSLDKAKNQDIALLVYGFGMLECGSEALWLIFMAQVI